MTGEQELQWLRAAQADPQRFAPLYDRYFGDVFRFVLRRAGDRELTADLTQQTFLKALMALGRYEPRYPVRRHEQPGNHPVPPPWNRVTG